MYLIRSVVVNVKALSCNMLCSHAHVFDYRNRIDQLTIDRNKRKMKVSPWRQ